MKLFVLNTEVEAVVSQLDEEGKKLSVGLFELETVA